MTQVYRGKPELVHIPDGQRAAIGEQLAKNLDYLIRERAIDAASDYNAIAGIVGDNPLCPGCYMVAVFNCAVALARANGQSLSELGNSLAGAFKALAESPNDLQRIESIEVQLDACTIPQ